MVIYDNLETGNNFDIDVLGHTFTVKIVDGISADDDTKTVGLIMHTDQVILVDGNQHKDRILTTLLREITHAILEITGHMESHNDEGMVDAIAFGFASLRLWGK